jgi:BrnA antitoxin of type II toxin-antitoxin system
MNDYTPASSFKKAAYPQQPETLLLDTEVLDWIKSEFSDWQGQINELLRFYMETTQIREASFSPDAFEPGEMADPASPVP